MGAERMMWVTMYAVACYSAGVHRVDKPFSPILGETYEWIAPDGSCRFVAEQVGGGVSRGFCVLLAC